MAIQGLVRGEIKPLYIFNGEEISSRYDFKSYGKSIGIVKDWNIFNNKGNDIFRNSVIDMMDCEKHCVRLYSCDKFGIENEVYLSDGKLESHSANIYIKAGSHSYDINPLRPLKFMNAVLEEVFDDLSDDMKMTSERYMGRDPMEFVKHMGTNNRSNPILGNRDEKLAKVIESYGLVKKI